MKLKGNNRNCESRARKEDQRERERMGELKIENKREKSEWRSQRSKMKLKGNNSVCRFSMKERQEKWGCTRTRERQGVGERMKEVIRKLRNDRKHVNQEGHKKRKTKGIRNGRIIVREVDLRTKRGTN